MSPDAVVERVLSWIRTIGFEDDVFYVDGPNGRGFLRFAFPSSPSDRPVRIRGPVPLGSVRFVVRTDIGLRRSFGGRELSPGPDVEAPEWRTILRLRDVSVFERDAPHGACRPLRLGLDLREGWSALSHARRCAEQHLAGHEDVSARSRLPELARLSSWSTVGVALWTRGRLRGSVVSPPGPALRGLGQAASWACRDARFEHLSPAELAETRFQITIVHAPAVPLSRREIETGAAYHDKALFLSEGTRSGVYLPEIFNVAPHRTLRALVDSLAREKAGLAGYGDATSVDVCEVTELVESADRMRAVQLDGPVARVADGDGDWRSRARAAGATACAWLAALQNEEGALPLRVRPSTGRAEGVDPPRMAMVAHALAAFGVAIDHAPAVQSSRRLLGWLDRARPTWGAATPHELLTTCYLGKAALCLGDEARVEKALTDALRLMDSAPREPLVLAHAASFFLAASEGRAEVAHRCESLQRELLDRFARARSAREPMSLAGWAELGAALETSGEIMEWLRSKQLPSGAFPDTTASDHVYSRGTGKVLEVLALRPADSMRAIECAVSWLLAMQYRADSMFFVPEEHRSRVSGGLRHDMFDADAWIDAAGHLILALARLEPTVSASMRR
jgi:AMMECR1 domain-containing protein